jgi:hypothetical protein
MGKRHELGRFVGGVAEHHALIAGAAGVDALRDVRRLTVDRAHHGARLGVEAEFRVVVTDAVDRLPDDLRQVHVGRRRDLTGDDGEPGGDQRLAGHTRRGSSLRMASRTASEIWSAILSGCPSVTDSDVKR